MCNINGVYTYTHTSLPLRMYMRPVVMSRPMGWLHMPVETIGCVNRRFLYLTPIKLHVGLALARVAIWSRAIPFLVYITLHVMLFPPPVALVSIVLACGHTMLRWHQITRVHPDRTEVMSKLRHHETHVYDQNGHFQAYGTTTLEDVLFYHVWKRGTSEHMPELASAKMYDNLVVAPISEELGTRGFSLGLIYVVSALCGAWFGEERALAAACTITASLYIVLADAVIFATAHNRGWYRGNHPYADDAELQFELYRHTLGMALYKWLCLFVWVITSWRTFHGPMAVLLCITNHSLANYMVEMDMYQDAMRQLRCVVEDWRVLRLVAELRYQTSWVPQGAGRYASVRSLVHALGHGRRGETSCAMRRRKRRIRKKMHRSC